MIPFARRSCGCCAFSLVFATPISAQDSAHNFTAMANSSFNRRRSQISPGGKRVVYVRRFADSMTDNALLQSMGD